MPQFVKLTFVAVFAGLVFAFIGVCIFGLAWKGPVKLSYFIVSAAIFVGSSLFSSFQCQFRGMFDQKEYSISSVVLVATKILLLLFLLPLSPDVAFMALAAMALSSVPVLIYQGTLLRKLFSGLALQTQEVQQDNTVFKRSFSYGMPLTLSLFVITMLQTGDRYLLSSLVSLKEIGIYAFWMGIGMQLGQGAYRIIFMAVNPRLFQLYSNDQKCAKFYVKRLVGLYLVFTVPLFTFLGCVLPYMLKWMKVNIDYFPLSHLIFFGFAAALLLGLTQLSGKQLEFTGKTKPFVYAACSGAVLMICLFAFLTPLAGLEGAATATLSGFLCYYLIVAHVSKGWPSLGKLLLGLFCGGFLFGIFQITVHIYGALLGIALVSVLLFVYSLGVHFKFVGINLTR